jgi:hypothetical protein
MHDESRARNRIPERFLVAHVRQHRLDAGREQGIPARVRPGAPDDAPAVPHQQAAKQPPHHAGRACDEDTVERAHRRTDGVTRPRA